MRICILQPFDEDQNPIEALDYALVDLAPLIPTHQWKHERLRQRTLNHQLEALLDQEIDVFVNLCDASETANGPGIEVVRFLEKHNLAFTGACSKFFEPSRVESKRPAATGGSGAAIFGQVGTKSLGWL